jgi:hypothetical protein
VNECGCKSTSECFNAANPTLIPQRTCVRGFKLEVNTAYGKGEQVDDMIPRVTVRETADAEVIRRALHLYLNYRAIEYHKSAARVELDEKLQLSIAYEGDKSFIEGLLRAVADGTMVAVSDSAAATDSEDGTSDE